MQERFTVLYCLTLDGLVVTINRNADTLGRCIFFGRNESVGIHDPQAFVAVFDNEALLVQTVEDLEIMNDFSEQRCQFLMSLENINAPDSA